MQHEHVVDGYAFRLRAIGDSDAEFLVGLRSDPELNQFLNSSTDSVQDQLDWFADYYFRNDDYYFVIETLASHLPQGVIALYNVDRQSMDGEWGRWILKPDSLAAIESAWLIYQFAFRVLGLQSVYCRTVVDNRKVVSFHDSCEIKKRKVLAGYFEQGTDKLDAIEHRLDHDDWQKIQDRLEMLSKMTARKVSDA